MLVLKNMFLCTKLHNSLPSYTKEYTEPVFKIRVKNIFTNECLIALMNFMWLIGENIF